MSTIKSKYYDRIIDGYLCTFDSHNHKCIGVLLSTGMDVKKWQDFNEKMIGKIDPNYTD